MDLKSYLHIVWKHKLIVAATVVVVVGVVIAGTLLTKPTYSATTLLRVTTATSGTFDQIRYELDYTDRLVNTYMRLVTSRPVLDELRQRLNIAVVPDITAEAIAKSELFQLTANAPDPELAANTANSVAQILIEQVKAANASYVGPFGEQVQQSKTDLDQALDDYQAALQEYGLSSKVISTTVIGAAIPARFVTSTLPNTVTVPYASTTYTLTTVDPSALPVQVAARNLDARQSIYASLLRQYEQAQATGVLLTQGLSVVEPATVPATPVSPRLTVNVLLALVVGLAAGVGLAFLVENWQSRGS